MTATVPRRKRVPLTDLVDQALLHGALQKQGELWAFGRLLADMQPRRVVEIGSAACGLLWFVAQLSARDARLVSVDIEQVPGCESDRDIRFITADSRLVETRDRAWDELGGEADLIIIDGAHDYHSAATDWGLYRPMLARSGVVAIHDCRPHADPNCGVHFLWQEIQANPDWLTVEIVGDQKQRWGGWGLVWPS